MLRLLLTLTAAGIAFAQLKYTWPDLAKARNPMLISLLIHVEEGKVVSPERYHQVAGGLRALGRVFHKHGARINLDIEPGFIRAMSAASDPLLKELEAGGTFSIGAFPHGAFAKETLDLIRENKATPAYLFGHWGRNNSDWVADAIRNDVDLMVGFFAIQAKEVTPGTPWDHEQLPWSRADRVNPWRIATTEKFLQHDPAGKVIYIPGDSIDELEKLYDRHVTGLFNRPLDFIKPKPELDEKDFEVASDYLRRQLVFASTGKINTWYTAVNTKKVRDFEAKAPFFDRWLTAVQTEFVRPGMAKWANAREVRQVYLDWEKMQK